MTLEMLKEHCSYLYHALHIPVYIVENHDGGKNSDMGIIEAFPEQEAYCYPVAVLKNIHFAPGQDRKSTRLNSSH